MEGVTRVPSPITHCEVNVSDTNGRRDCSLTYCSNLLHHTQIDSDSQKHHHLSGLLMTAVMSEFHVGMPGSNHPLTTDISLNIFNRLCMSDLSIRQHAAPALYAFGSHYAVQVK